MTWLRAMLRDRRTRQRGSVLSGVLIITAFVAIIASALMTELSTNFLLSRSLGNRVADEATMNSAVELTLSQMLATPLNNACPNPNFSPVTLNSRTAVASYASCWPTVDSRTQPAIKQILNSNSGFTIDGTHAQLNGLNDLVLGNTGGTIYDFTFGSPTPRWSLPLTGQLTGPPLVIPNPHANGQFLDVIPMGGAVCAPSPYCLSIRADSGQAIPPLPMCVYPLNAAVTTRPAAASSANPGLIYFTSGTNIYAVDVSSGGAQCDWEASTTVSGAQPVSGGPVSFPCASACPSGTDEVYAVTSSGSSSQLLRFAYRNGSFQSLGGISVPAGVAGVATSGPTLPATIVMTFVGGQIATAQLSVSGAITAGPTAAINAGISDAPYWCVQCGNVIGVAGQDGGLYLYSSNLAPLPSYPPPGPAIGTSPSADGAGNWYFGAADGYVYEVPAQPGNQQLSWVRRYGRIAAVGSSVQVGGCPTGICIYVGDLDSDAYLVPLDARDAVITACISVSPPACSGENPRLWATVEVGANSLQTVHVGGWSYFSA